MNQWDFTAPFEGVVPHMYLDTAGHVTAGVGFMFPDLKAARALTWQPPGEVDLDWVSVRALPAGKPASFYRKHTNARLSDATMRAEFQVRVAAFERAVIKAGVPLQTYPALARVALVDMAFNLGTAGLLKYKKLLAACAVEDWRAAAAECSRRGIQAARNDATRAVFEKCYLERP